MNIIASYICVEKYFLMQNLCHVLSSTLGHKCINCNWIFRWCTGNEVKLETFFSWFSWYFLCGCECLIWFINWSYYLGPFILKRALKSDSNKKWAENWMLCFDKSKESSVYSIILQRFLVIFSTPTFISFTTLKIIRSFWATEQV